jgi:hypothetical protein
MKTLSTVAALMAFSLGLQSAQAGLMGLPLNLKTAIEHIEVDGSTTLGNPFREVPFDNMPSGSWLISC